MPASGNAPDPRRQCRRAGGSGLFHSPVSSAGARQVQAWWRCADQALARLTTMSTTIAQRAGPFGPVRDSSVCGLTGEDVRGRTPQPTAHVWGRGSVGSRSAVLTMWSVGTSAAASTLGVRAVQHVRPHRGVGDRAGRRPPRPVPARLRRTIGAKVWGRRGDGVVDLATPRTQRSRSWSCFTPR